MYIEGDVNFLVHFSSLSLLLFPIALKWLMTLKCMVKFGRIRVAAVAAASSVARVPSGQKLTGHKPLVS